MCSSRKYPYPPQGRLMEIPWGRGFQKPISLMDSVPPKWNFQRGWGVKAKKPSVGGDECFLEQHNVKPGYLPLGESHIERLEIIIVSLREVNQ